VFIRRAVASQAKAHELRWAYSTDRDGYVKGRANRKANKDLPTGQWSGCAYKTGSAGVQFPMFTMNNCTPTAVSLEMTWRIWCRSNRFPPESPVASILLVV
jgi:hypothetical protein